MNLKDFITKALSADEPSEYFRKNRKIGESIFPALYKLKNIPEMRKYHYHDNTFDHIMMVVDEVAKNNDKLNVRFAALMHDIGKVNTGADILPHHYEHEKRGIDKLHELAGEKLPDKYIDSAAVVIRYHMMVKNWNDLRPGTVVDMFNAIYNSPISIGDFMIIIKADNLKKKNQKNDIPYERIIEIYNQYKIEIKERNIGDRNKQSKFISDKK